jgi:nucleotide-binding universal stress UspA family protein
MLKLLLATDGSECSEQAREFLTLLPLPAGSSIEVVSVIDQVVGATAPALEDGTLVWHTGAEIREAERKRAWEWVRQAEAALVRDGVAINGAVPSGDAAHELILAAEAIEADLIVLGSRGLTGLKGFVLGSVARNVAKHARRPVLIARAAPNGLRQVVLGVDGSPHAAQAVEFLARLPLPTAAEVTVAHVVRPYDPHPRLALGGAEAILQAAGELNFARREAGEQLVAAACARLEAAGKRCSPSLPEGDPADALLKLAADRGADLIASGARGVSLIQGLVVGSVADRILKSAACSVLIVH